MTIKELERRTGLPRTSIRFYEQEGFLAPERRENNYRDYSEADARTLEKIKLLRQLSLDLDTIRRIQAEEVTLSQALASQAQALEGDQADLARYAQVCWELSQARTSYQELDPEPWLSALAERSLPLSRRVDPAQQDSIAAAPYPWRRFWARMLDLSLTAILWYAFQHFGLRWYWPEQAFYGIPDILIAPWGGWLFLLILEPVLLATWGYTPGKWLMRLSVRREDGRKLDWETGVGRAVKVFVRGFGLCLPLYNLVRLSASYDQCKNDQVMPWDTGLRYTVRPVGRGRIALMVVCLLLSGMADGCVEDVSWRPPHPGGPLTPEQVVENYNFLERRDRDRNSAPYPSVLASDGTWEQAPASYLDGQWVNIQEAGESEWGPLLFTTDDQGCATGFTITWTPSASPYTSELSLISEVKYLSKLILALSPAGASWESDWQDAWERRNWAATFMALDLREADFTRPGEYHAERDDRLPGLSVTMEVVETTGIHPIYMTDSVLVDESKLAVEAGEPYRLVLRFAIFLAS